MKVYVFPADEHGCGHYRLIWPAEQLQLQGMDVVIVRPKDRDGMLSGVVEKRKLIDVQIPADADVVVFQRVTHHLIAQAVKLIRARGVAVVVDMDDDLTCIDPRNPAHALLHPKNTNAEHDWRYALDACRDATLVTTSTDPLIKRYASHGRGVRFDNYIPSSVLSQERTDNAMVGWAGSLHSHPGDLQTMGSSVNRLMQEGVEFAVIGGLEGIHRAWGVPGEWNIHYTGPTTVHDWTRALGQLGVGVAPLAETKFNTAKSWLKMLEYAAAGVPAVGADMPEYDRLHKMGIGLKARKPNDWYNHLKNLATCHETRAELSARGREVAAGLTMEANAWKLGEIWTDALKTERSRALGAWSRR